MKHLYIHIMMGKEPLIYQEKKNMCLVYGHLPLPLET